MKLFYWTGKLFIGSAKDAVHQVLNDEINKVEDEIANSIIPILAHIPEGLDDLDGFDKKKMLTDIVAIAKQAAIAYAEASINVYMPHIPARAP